MSEAIEGERVAGKDCPKGKVQIEFVGVSPELRQGEYGWKPSDDATVDIYIDGQRFFVAVGTRMTTSGEERRGLHIIGPAHLEVDHHSVNALGVYLPKSQS